MDVIFSFKTQKQTREVYNNLTDQDKMDCSIFGDGTQIYWTAINPLRLHCVAEQMTGYKQIITLDKTVKFTYEYILYLERHYLMVTGIYTYGREKPEDYDPDAYAEEFSDVYPDSLFINDY